MTRVKKNCPSFDKEGRAQRREFEITHRSYLCEHAGSPVQWVRFVLPKCGVLGVLCGGVI